MAKENKKSVYITSENIKYLSEEAERTKKKSISQIFNKIVNKFRNIIMFTKESNAKEYVNACFSIRPELSELLQEVQRKYGTDAVIELVNLRLLEEFNNQIKGGRRRFPDRTYSWDDYITKLAEKCKKFLKLKGTTFQ